MEVDAELRVAIKQGLFNEEFLWFAAGLYRTIAPECNPGTMILPKPARMVEAEKALDAEISPQKRFARFLETRCAWCTRGDECRGFQDPPVVSFKNDRLIIQASMLDVTGGWQKQHLINVAS